MIILTQINDGHIASCQSDDGLVTAIVTPTTTTYGEFNLVDASGRQMWRGVYQDADRYYRNVHVPADIWESACVLMREWNSWSKAREDASCEHDNEIILDRKYYNSLSVRIAENMDRADSDL